MTTEHPDPGHTKSEPTGAQAAGAPGPDPSRPGETDAEKLDRNTIELLNEIRVMGTGIQVLFGFLLVLPFYNGFHRLDTFERTVYFITLISVAGATVLLMAPSIHHRILFRHHEKPFLLAVANRLAIVAMGFLTVSFTGILLLISDVVIGGSVFVVVPVLAASVIIGLWFGVPIARRRREPYG